MIGLLVLIGIIWDMQTVCELVRGCLDLTRCLPGWWGRAGM